MCGFIGVFKDFGEEGTQRECQDRMNPSSPRLRSAGRICRIFDRKSVKSSNNVDRSLLKVFTPGHPRITRARSATCCGVAPDRIHSLRRAISASESTTGELLRDIQPCFYPPSDKSSYLRDTTLAAQRAYSNVRPRMFRPSRNCGRR